MIHNNIKLILLLSVLLLVQNLDLTLKKSNLNRHCRLREELGIKPLVPETPQNKPEPVPEKPQIPEYYPDGYYEFKNNENYPIPLGVGSHIRSEENTNECVGYNENSNQWIWSIGCHGNWYYSWIITKVGDAYLLTLENYKKSEKKHYVMDLEGDATVPKVYDPKSKTQLWKFTPRTKEHDEPNNFNIVSVANGQCLNNYNDHRRLKLVNCDPEARNRGWWFAPAPKLYPIITDKWINLRSHARLKCVSYQSSPAPGYLTNSRCLTSLMNNLAFKLTKRGEDTYTISIKNDENKNLVLDSGATPSIYDANKKTQLWKFLPHASPEQGNHYYMAKNVVMTNA